MDNENRTLGRQCYFRLNASVHTVFSWIRDTRAYNTERCVCLVLVYGQTNICVHGHVCRIAFIWVSLTVPRFRTRMESPYTFARREERTNQNTNRSMERLTDDFRTWMVLRLRGWAPWVRVREPERSFRPNNVRPCLDHIRTHKHAHAHKLSRRKLTYKTYGR